MAIHDLECHRVVPVDTTYCEESGSSSSLGLAVGLSVGMVLLIAAVIGTVLYLKKRRGYGRSKSESVGMNPNSSEFVTFSPSTHELRSVSTSAVPQQLLEPPAAQDSTFKSSSPTSSTSVANNPASKYEFVPRRTSAPPLPPRSPVLLVSASAVTDMEFAPAAATDDIEFEQSGEKMRMKPK